MKTPEFLTQIVPSSEGQILKQELIELLLSHLNITDLSVVNTNEELMKEAIIFIQTQHSNCPEKIARGLIERYLTSITFSKDSKVDK